MSVFILVTGLIITVYRMFGIVKRVTVHYDILSIDSRETNRKKVVESLRRVFCHGMKIVSYNTIDSHRLNARTYT